MAGIVNGQPVDQSASNAAWIAKNGDDATVGIIALQKVDVPGSGAFIDNIQAELNADASYTGRTTNVGPGTTPTYANNQGFTSNESLRSRADGLTGKFHSSTGHGHSGNPGDGPPIASSTLADVPLAGYIVQGTSLSGVTGSTYDLSSAFTGFVASSGPTSEGVVVSSPFNKVVLRQSDGTNQGDPFKDGSGNLVYGRITNSGITWTLSFYVMIGGTETAYSFSSSDIDYYYQRLYNPMVNPPVYNSFAITPSDNATADVIDATTSLKGKVQLATTATPVGGSTLAGTANATVANADHAHQGLHSVALSADLVQLFGDIQLSASGGMAIARSGNTLMFTSSAGSSNIMETLAGTVDGLNATFGPTSHTPTGAGAMLVFLDGVLQPSSAWTLNGSNQVVFGTAPTIDQGSPEVYYVYSGAVLGTTVSPKTEFRTLSSLEASAGSLTLALTPITPGDTLVDVIGGGAQAWSSDYTISGSVLSWSGLGLDGILAAGDQLRIFYHYAT